jgi:hypothetical protein
MPARVLIVCSILIAWLSAPRAADAASFSFYDERWDGTSELLRVARERLGKDRVEVLDELVWDRLRPGDGVIILHPERDIDYVETLAFLRAGGRLALLDDYGRGDSLLERFKIRRVAAPRKPVDSIRDNPQLAIAVPAVQVVAGQEQGRHPIVASVAKLVTNHPTGLVHPNLTPVLTIPGALDEPDVTLAVTGIIADRGRLLAMGDPSAVMNLMLRYPGNRAFAEGLVDYLVEDDSWGSRGGRLYLLSNDFGQRGSYGGRSTLAKRFQDQIDSAREQLTDVHQHGIPATAALVLAALAALAAIGWVTSTSTRPYRRPTPRFARRTDLIAQGGAAGRAALLSAPTTHRALAVLELKSALEEGLVERLGLPDGAVEAEILTEIDRQQALSQPSSSLLRILLVEMRKTEAAVVASEPVRVTKKKVKLMHAQVEEILQEVVVKREAGA